MTDNKSIVEIYWQKINKKHWDELPDFFTFDARIVWPNTAEDFEVSRFLEVNRNYPGDWTITPEKIISSFETVISVVLVSDGKSSFHAISFFYFVAGKIAGLEEYWSEDSDPPIWRRFIN